MINVYNVVTALKTVISGVSGVGGVRVGSGDLNKLDTVAVEVVATNTTIADTAFSQNKTQDDTTIDIYFACKANQQDPQDHEQRLHTVVKAFVDTVSTSGFDRSLSGACEYFLLDGAAYDYIRDDNKLYYAAVVRVIAHDSYT